MLIRDETPAYRIIRDQRHELRRRGTHAQIKFKDWSIADRIGSR